MNAQETAFQHPIRVPFGHADLAGIVWTPRFTDYCMEAAEQFLRERVGLDWVEINLEGTFSNPVMGLELDFHQAVLIGDQLSLTVSVARRGRSSFTLAIVGHRQAGGVSEACFSARLSLAFVDLKAHKSIPIPARYLAGLTPSNSE